MGTTPPQGPADYYAEGDWNARCFFCYTKHKGSELIQHWQGFWLCSKCWEPRQPQDFVRGVQDKPAAPFVQASPEDFIDNFCTPNSSSAVPGQAIPGCFYPGYISPAYNPDSPI